MVPQLTRRLLLFTATAFIPALRLSANSPRGKLTVQAASARISAIESRLGGRLGVAALNLRDGNRIEHRASERFPMCSTFKFLLAADILSRVDAGHENLDRVIHYTQSDLLEYAPITKTHVHEGGMSISALCAAAAEYGDNTAANLLLAAVGGPQSLTAYVHSLGDSATRTDRNEPSANTCIPGDPRDTTTPSAMLHDMRTLLLGSRALSADSRRQLTAWLGANTTGATRLRAGLPSSWRIGDRTGTGDNGSANDIAICWPPNRAPILIASYFTGSHASDADRSAALAEVGRIVAAAFS